VITPGLFWPHQAIVYARNEPLSISMPDPAAAFTCTNNSAASPDLIEHYIYDSLLLVTTKYEKIDASDIFQAACRIILR